MAARPEDVAPYHDAGYELIPLRRADKPPRDAQWRGRRYGREEIDAAVADGYNVGVRLRTTDLVCDWDPRNAGAEPDEAYRALWARAGAEPGDFPCVRTGGGGLHFYMQLPPETRVKAHLPDLPGWDFKGAGGFVVAAGSLHPSGAHYAWEGEDGADLALLGAPAAPEALLALVRRPAATQADLDAGLPGLGDLTAEQLQLVLDQIDVAGYADNASWLELGMACWYATAGLGEEAFVAWSLGDPEFADHEELIRTRWRSWAPEPGTVPITGATLRMHLAQAGGSWDGMHADDYPEDLGGWEPPPEAVGAAAGPDGPLEELNERFAVAREGDKVWIFQRVRDGEGWARLSERQFRLQLAGRWIARATQDGVRQVSLAKAWLDWPQHATYAAARFAPQGTPANVLNLWTGWGVEPLPAGAPEEAGTWHLLERLIRDDLVDGDGAAAEYVLNWMAWMVQRPEVLPEVALVFRGPPGVGKGTLGRALLKLAGLHGQQLTSMRQLVGQFNAHMMALVYSFADEAFWAAHAQGEATFKGMVTEPALLFERKGGTPAMARNYLHVVIASNKDWVVPAQMGERRFAVFDVPGERHPVSWYADLHEELEQGGYRAMLRDLLARPLGPHPREGVPQTAALAEQKVLSLDPVGEWWRTVLSEGAPPSGTMFDGLDDPDPEADANPWEEGPIRVPSQQLQLALEAYLRRAGAAGRRNLDRRLGQWLEKAVPGLRRVRVREGKRRPWAYDLPPLAECRRGFEALVGAPLDW